MGCPPLFVHGAATWTLAPGEILPRHVRQGKRGGFPSVQRWRVRREVERRQQCGAVQPAGERCSRRGGEAAVSHTLLTAFALMLVIEGVLPFLVPTLWRDTFRRLTELSDGQIRFIGLTSMLAGLLLLYIVRP